MANELTITPANVVPSAGAVFEQLYCGTTAVTAGQVVYKHTTTLKAELSQGDTLAKSLARGIAAHGASPNQPLRIVRKDDALAIGATVAEGTLLAVSAAVAGGIYDPAELASGNFMHVFGVALESNVVKVDFVNPLATSSALPA
jgi:hypothetical protein